MSKIISLEDIVEWDFMKIWTTDYLSIEYVSYIPQKNATVTSRIMATLI